MARGKPNALNLHLTLTNKHQLLQVGSKEADAKRQESAQQPQSQQKAPAQNQNPNHASGGAPQDRERSRSSSPEDDAGNEWPDYRSSGSSYNQQSQQSQSQSQSGKQSATGGKGYSVASTHDYLGYGSSKNGQRQEKGFQQDLWDDDKEGDLW